MDFEEKIEPFFWVTHKKEFSVCLYVCIVDEPTYKEEVFMTRKDEGFHGSGYDWTSLAIAFLKEKMPELQKIISFDPEGSMFSAYSSDPGALKRFILSFKELCEDNVAFRELFSRVDIGLYALEPEDIPEEDAQDIQDDKNRQTEQPFVIQETDPRFEKAAISENPLEKEQLRQMPETAKKPPKSQKHKHAKRHEQER